MIERALPIQLMLQLLISDRGGGRGGRVSLSLLLRHIPIAAHVSIKGQSEFN